MISHAMLLLMLIFNISYGFNGVFWQISDIHLNMSYKTNHHNEKQYDNFIFNSPLNLISSVVTAMKKIQPNPDFILWNGDNVVHMSLDDDNYFKTMYSVSRKLRDAFSSTNILPSLGNHDINKFVNSSIWCTKLIEYWSLLVNDTMEIESFKKGCYYSRIVNLNSENRAVIVLNTIMWYSSNKAVENLSDPYGQFKWMQDELNKSRRNALKVFIVGSVPPGASEYSPKVERHLHPQYNEMLFKILQQNSDIIEAGFFSTQHTDSFKIVYNNKDEAIVPLFLSPSMRPSYMNNIIPVNPSIRLYNWPKEESHRFYSQYQTTMPKESNNISLSWLLEYKSTDILPSLSARQLDSLLTDMTSTNSLYFEKYFKYHLSGRVDDQNERCPSSSRCRCHIVCSMRHIRYPDLTSCMTKCMESAASGVHQVPLIITVIVVFTFILVVTVVAVNKVYCHHRRSSSLTRDIFMASYNGKDCEQIVSDHIDDIAEVTFGDVPEYRGHMRNNSRTILTLNDGNEIVDKSQPSLSKFAISSKDSKSHEKYDYSRM